MAPPKYTPQPTMLPKLNGQRQHQTARRLFRSKQSKNRTKSTSDSSSKSKSSSTSKSHDTSAQKATSNTRTRQSSTNNHPSSSKTQSSPTRRSQSLESRSLCSGNSRSRRRSKSMTNRTSSALSTSAAQRTSPDQPPNTSHTSNTNYKDPSLQQTTPNTNTLAHQSPNTALLLRRMDTAIDLQHTIPLPPLSPRTTLYAQSIRSTISNPTHRKAVTDYLSQRQHASSEAQAQYNLSKIAAQEPPETPLPTDGAHQYMSTLSRPSAVTNQRIPPFINPYDKTKNPTPAALRAGAYTPFDLLKRHQDHQQKLSAQQDLHREQQLQQDTEWEKAVMAIPESEITKESPSTPSTTHTQPPNHQHSPTDSSTSSISHIDPNASIAQLLQQIQGSSNTSSSLPKGQHHPQQRPQASPRHPSQKRKPPPSPSTPSSTSSHPHSSPTTLSSDTTATTTPYTRYPLPESPYFTQHAPHQLPILNPKRASRYAISPPEHHTEHNNSPPT